MGLYDRVHVLDKRFVCSEGHSLVESAQSPDGQFQSKDFGCTMGTVTIHEDGTITQVEGGYGGPAGVDAEAEIYADCIECPAFVQYGTGNLCACWVSFLLRTDGSRIAPGTRVLEVTRTSPATKDWLATEPTKKWMANCHGPMTYKEAWNLHVGYPHNDPKIVEWKAERRREWEAEMAEHKAGRGQA